MSVASEMPFVIIVEPNPFVGEDLRELIAQCLPGRDVVEAPDAGLALQKLSGSKVPTLLGILNLADDDADALVLIERLLADGAGIVLIDDEKGHFGAHVPPSRLRTIMLPFRTTDVERAIRELVPRNDDMK